MDSSPSIVAPVSRCPPNRRKPTFLGWTLDGQPVGFASPLTFTVGGDRTLVARFAARPAFANVAPNGIAWDAITQLAARGLAAPCFGPADTILRAQIAALIVRALG